MVNKKPLGKSAPELMSETLRISRTQPERTSMHYATLRESGMALIRQLAQETWTDHNVHDPGITLLEAFIYAMTELGLRLQLDVADLLRSAEAHAPTGLVPAHRVLPCGPVTLKDLRKLLLDHPLVSDAWITTQADSEVPFYEAPASDPPSDPPFTYLPGTARVLLRGLFEVVLEFAAMEGNSNTGALQQLQRYLSTWRNLCEEPVRVAVAGVQEIAIRARIEVTGSTDLERLLAEIFLAIDRLLSPPVRFYSLAEMRANGKGVEQVFDGPLLRHGFLDDAIVDNLAGPAVLYTSDILRLIMRRRSAAGTDLVAQENPTGRDIVAVTDLALSNFVNNRPITTDAQDCLRLVEIARYRPRLSLAKSRLILVRNDAEVAYDIGRVESLFVAMQQQERATALLQNPSLVWPVLHGESLPVEDYYPFQNELPHIYGVGEARLPESVGTERQAAILQLQGYLLLFEQFLADLTAQLGHLNRFFSPDPGEQATYFPRALFDLPAMQKLLKSSPPKEDDWQDFIANPTNPYRLALQKAAESRDRFLDRRNRMLDHLLARQGEEMVAWGQELHRWAQTQLTEATPTPDELPARMDLRRQAANARLLRAKAAFLFDIPELNANRLQAFGNPLQRQPELLRFEPRGTGYGWGLAPDEPGPGETLLRGVDSSATEAAAAIAAEEAVVLAAQEAFYKVITAPDGRQRYQLQDGPDDVTDRVVAESPQTWGMEPDAQEALKAAAVRFRAIRLAYSLTPMERRIAHLTGIRSQVRRCLLVPVTDFFEIVGEDDDPKSWRLRELLSPTGRELLRSALRFSTCDEAWQSIHRVLQYGMDEWNYQVSVVPGDPTTYSFELQDPAGARLGRPESPVPSPQEAEQAMAATIDHLYRLYSAEGFHVVEHVLLRPRQNGDPFLSFPISETERERDPYSQRLSFIFPSGYARNFLGNTQTREPVTPHRFRDLEFRRHAERMIQQECPAHLLPSIYWVDRQIPEPPDAPEPPDTLGSFEHFEKRYFDWLESLLIPGTAPDTVTSARAALIVSLNGIARG
jgi:hypothetical protein